MNPRYPRRPSFRLEMNQSLRDVVRARTGKAADNLRNLLEKTAIRIGKRGGRVAVDVEFAYDFAVRPDRRHDLRSRSNRAREVAWVGVDIVHDDRFARGNRRAADSLVDRYPDMRRRLAHERAEHEHLPVERIEHVKAHPIVVRKCARDRLHRFLLEQVETLRSRGRSPNSFEQFGERLEGRHAQVV
jgi:hypothetical protein